MKVFNYKTKRGTEIELTINSSSDIEMYVKGKGRFKAFDSFDFDSEFNNCPSIKIDHKIDNKSIYVNITDEIYRFIKELKEDERINSLPLKEQIKAKLKKLKKKLSFTYFVDTDLVTGMKYYALSNRVEKEVWSKIAKYFEFIDTSYRSDNFDAMYGGNYKGYLTTQPHKVEAILRDIFDVSNLEKELKKLENKLKEIEYKEKHDVEYRKSLFKKGFDNLLKKFPNYKTELKKLENKLNGIGKIKEVNITTFELLNVLLGDFDKDAKKMIYEPTEVPKVTSSAYSGGYVYMQKDGEDVAIIPTEKYIVVAVKNEYSKEWWNQWDGISINGFFAPFGFTDITIYPNKGDLFRLLEKFGYKYKHYGECGKWFIVTKKGYTSDLLNVVTLSEDYDDWVKTEADALEQYKREKRWEWDSGNYPTLEDIKYIGKFKKF